MATRLMSFWGHEVRIFKVLQHGSTGLGLALLACWYWRWFKLSPETIEPEESTLSKLSQLTVTATLVAIPCGFGLFSAIPSSTFGLFPVTGQFVVATISASCLVALGYSFLYCLLERRRDRRAGETGRRPPPPLILDNWQARSFRL